MHKRQAHSNAGFTLVELLTVLAVIGILMTVLVPSVGTVRRTARIAKAKSDLRQVALSYAAFAQGGERSRSLNADDIYDWALSLATETGMNDATIFYLDDDPLVERSAAARPVIIADTGESGKWSLSEAFDGFPLSVVVVNRLPAQANASTTPVAWTRGLGSDGRWAALDAEQPAPFGDYGGIIAYLDGHVEFHRDLGEGGGRLVEYLTGKPTADIRKALPPGAEALDMYGEALQSDG